MENKGNPGLKTGALSLTDCIMIAVGGMVGSSIFTLSGVTYSLAGPAAILSWVIGGGILFLYALNVAELATTFPRTGGLYVYPYEVLGSTLPQRTFFGWLAAWSWINVTVLGTAFSAIFVANYLASVVPGADKHVVLVALIWIGLCWLLNVLGISLMGKTNLVLTAILIGICVFYIAYGLPHIDMNMFSNFFAGGYMGTKGIIASIPMAMLAYGSVIAVASVAEEIRDPKKTIPKAMGLSVLITVLMYTLILFVTYGIVPWKEITPDSFAYYAPLHYAVVKYAPAKVWLSTLISVGALLAITTTMLVMVMDAGRTVMAIAQSGFLPKSLAKVHERYQTPAVALTVVSAAACIIACFPQFIMQIIGTGSFTSGVMVGIIAITLIATRLKNIKAEGAFKVPGGYIVPFITLIVLVIVLSQLPKDSFTLSGWWYLIAVVYYIIKYPALKSDKKGGVFIKQQ